MKLKKDQPLVSHHLKTLKKCGIVKSRDEGKKGNVYAISNNQLIRINYQMSQRQVKKIPVLCSDDECC